MGLDQFIIVGRETIYVVVLAIGPLLVAALAVGVFMGIIQAATSINEQTLAFVPKLLVVIGIFMLAGPFMFSTVTGFFQTIFTEIGRVGR
jgi:flagellar biosynthetic protein FliQ